MLHNLAQVKRYVERREALGIAVVPTKRSLFSRASALLPAVTVALWLGQIHSLFAACRYALMSADCLLEASRTKGVPHKFADGRSSSVPSHVALAGSLVVSLRHWWRGCFVRKNRRKSLKSTPSLKYGMSHERCRIEEGTPNSGIKLRTETGGGLCHRTRHHTSSDDALAVAANHRCRQPAPRPFLASSLFLMMGSVAGCVTVD